VIAVDAADAPAARAAEAAARSALAAGAAVPVGAGAPRRPRTLETALSTLRDASLALISVPGPYAAAEARKALRRGLHVMLFSDNVPLDDEVALKRAARARGLFMLGPDCGTAIIAGVPLGFANAVPRGRIGIAAASGTGLQEVACLVAAAGEGISHAIGVGGRDLSDAVGGLMTEAAIDALAGDAGTRVVCVIGKPPGAGVARRLATRAEKLGKPCVLGFVGAGATGTLEDAARAAVACARGVTPAAVEFSRPRADVGRLVSDARRRLDAARRFVRGVYAGGTLAWEAVSVLATTLTGVAPEVLGRGGGHRVVDLGEDVFTVGRPHPMIDGTVRRERIAEEAADPATAVILLDVVLGYGAHPDPAGELLPALTAAAERCAVVASVVGTDADPQHRGAQVAKLEAAGVVVMPSNAQAARLAAAIVAR
jgi:FdrA protein